MTKYITYEKTGVNILANDAMVEHIRASVRSTFDDRVIAHKNGFAGLFKLDFDDGTLYQNNYRKPVLVSCTDGVGTKIIIAQMMNTFDTVGIDLVAMNVNDMIVQGAEPFFFLDYIAIDKLVPGRIAELVDGIALGCRQARCALIGGETAEMPDIYQENEFDLAGFAVGVVEHDRIITGKTVREGDVILGLPSSGLHSNGYSLVRHICFTKQNLKPTDTIEELGGRLADVLLEPTLIYVSPIVELLQQYKVKKIIHGMAHITGGGLVGNIPRMLPKNCNAEIDTASWEVPPIFKYLQKTGPVEFWEMYRVFNMGIGFVLVVAKDFADSVVEKLKKYGRKGYCNEKIYDNVFRIGTITAGKGKVVLK